MVYVSQIYGGRVMKHKRYPITTVECSFEQFQREAYSVRIFTGTIFINLKNGLFGYRDDLNRVVPGHKIFQKARSVNNFKGKLIAKRSAKDQPLQIVKYKNK